MESDKWGNRKPIGRESRTLSALMHTGKDKHLAPSPLDGLNKVYILTALHGVRGPSCSLSGGLSAGHAEYTPEEVVRNK